MRHSLLICVKNPFSERDLERMGISALETHFDVTILDCTAWLMPDAFATRGGSRLVLPNLRSISSLREFRNEIRGRTGGFAVDYVGPFSAQAILLFNELKRVGFKLVVVDSGAYPVPQTTAGKPSLLAKLMRALRHGGLRQHANGLVIRLLLRALPDQTPDFALVAGQSWRNERRFAGARQIIQAHSFDYETYLKLRGEQADRGAGYVVYLDEDITGHEDNAELGFADPATASRFYPALNAFFDAFERQSGLRVIVAGYPSADRKKRESCFRGREVMFGKSAELIRDAELVFAHASTAISFAVLWRKPIVFLTSQELMASWYQVWIEAPCKLLQASQANIDARLADSWKVFFNTDSAAYGSYQEKYIKAEASPDLSLWEIFTHLGNTPAQAV